MSASSPSVDIEDLASPDEVKVFRDEGQERKNASASEMGELSETLINEEEQQQQQQLQLISQTHPTPHRMTPHGNKVGPIVGPHPVGSPAFFPHVFPTPPPAHTGIHIDSKGIARPALPYPLASGQHHPYALFSPEHFAHLNTWSLPMYPMTSAAGFARPAYPTLSASQSSFPLTRFPGQPLIPPYPSPLSQHQLLATSKHNDFMAAFLNHQNQLEAERGLNAFTQSQLSHLNFHHPPAGMQLPLSLPDQKPHMSLSRVNGSTGTGSPGGQSRSGSSPSPDCKAKIGSINVNNNRLNHANQNHQNNCSSNNNNASNNNNNHSSSNHSTSSNNSSSSNNNNSSSKNAMGHVKKPLNAFMLYMKEQRTKVVSEHMLKESAAINQILGKKWHALSRDEQSKYYEMARRERQLHQQLYPGWTARDNYAINQKKKKKKRDKSVDGEPGSLKKCRARFGLDQQSSWCKPCRRKKKCIRYSESADQAPHERDNLGSVGSTEAQTPDSKSANDSDDADLNLSSAELSLSSPPVPCGAHLSPPRSHHFHARLTDLHRSSQSTTSSASLSLASLQGPPRNSPIGPNNPLSIEQLTRPHLPRPAA